MKQREATVQIHMETANSANMEILCAHYSAQLSFASEQVPKVDCPAPPVK